MVFFPPLFLLLLLLLQNPAPMVRLQSWDVTRCWFVLFFLEMLLSTSNLGKKKKKKIEIENADWSKENSENSVRVYYVANIFAARIVRVVFNP